jgi:hypothetical protein
MKRVHFVANPQSIIVDLLLGPVLYNRRQLRERGYQIRFFRAPHDTALDCDILCLVSKSMWEHGGSAPVFQEPHPMLDILRRARTRADKIIWFDIADGTGVTHFELLPYVDVYLRKQLLRDRSLYEKAFYGGRIYSDYFHRKYQIDDETPFCQFTPLAQDRSHQVGLSWNVGMGSVQGAYGRLQSIRRRILGFAAPSYRMRFRSPHKPRPLDVFMSTTTHASRSTISHHRREVVDRLDALLRQKNLTGSVRRKSPLPSMRQYLRNVMHSKIAPSPFSYGDLNLRDFEALAFGAALLKTDVSYLETWPDFFTAHVTYLPFAWDCSDLETQCERLLDDTSLRLAIAEAGHERFRAVSTPEGMQKFCEYFVQQVERQSFL